MPRWYSARTDGPAMISRRSLLRSVPLAIAATAAARPSVGRAFTAPATISRHDPKRVIRRPLLDAALERFHELKPRIKASDLIGIVDFSRHSSEPRFHVLDMHSGDVSTHLVSHGRGSDPAHTGLLQRFSNTPGSNASSDGAYITGARYVGQHGPSMRLHGVDPTNDNAEARAIVLHSAWYVSKDLVRQHGKIGRSQGCFAVNPQELAYFLDKFGNGRLLYAAKV